jgi:hypothetical protein
VANLAEALGLGQGNSRAKRPLFISFVKQKSSIQSGRWPIEFFQVRFIVNGCRRCGLPKNMNHKAILEKIESMRRNLAEVRQASMRATRVGDYMKVASLGTEAARLNNSIMDAETEMLIRR